MSRIATIQSNISASMEAFRGEDPYPNLLRSVADQGVYNILTALTYQDDALPILTADTLGASLKETSDNLEGWQVCQEYMEQPSKPVKHGRAMLFFGTSPKYGKLATVSMDGFRAFRKKEDQVVSTFAVDNTFGLGNRKAHRREVTVPGLIFNSAIDTVQINYDLRSAGKGNGYMSRYMLFRPGKDGAVKVYEEREIGQSLANNKEVKPKISNFKKVGELTMELDGTAVIDSNHYYQAMLQGLIVASK